MIDSGIYNPIIAYCKERIKQCQQPGTDDWSAADELKSVIVLCEGLNRQQELIAKAFCSAKKEALDLYDNR